MQKLSAFIANSEGVRGSRVHIRVENAVIICVVEHNIRRPTNHEVFNSLESLRVAMRKRLNIGENLATTVAFQALEGMNSVVKSKSWIRRFVNWGVRKFSALNSRQESWRRLS